MFCYEALPKEIWQDIFRLLLVDDINKLYEVLPLNSEWSVVVGERLFRTMVIQREHLPWTAKRLRLGGWMGEIMSLSGSSFLALHQHEKSYIKRIFFSCFFCPGQEHNDIDCPPISQKLVDDIKLLEGISAISFICPNINFLIWTLDCFVIKLTYS